MSEESLPELTDRQKEVIDKLPASKESIADDLFVSPSTIQDHLNKIRERGIDLQFDEAANQWWINDERAQKLRRISTKHKTTKTREATSIIEDEESRLLRRLNRTEPLNTPPAKTDGSESFCLILGDLHFGDLVEKEYWDDEAGEYKTRVVYDSEIAADMVEHFGEKALYFKGLMSNVTTFDDAYLFLMGDIATGEGIYEGQVHDIESHLADQTTDSVSALYQLCITLAEEFETLQVRGVLGNHGKDRASASHGANTDLITYRWLDDRLRDSGYDNVNFAVGEAYHHLNTKVRDWTVHVRHGQDGKEHVDETSYSEKLWRGWQEEFDFDLAMKGHHHNPAYHKVLNKYPVFSAPSPKPGGEFASRIGSPDVSDYKDVGWVFGSSDKRPVTWRYLVDSRP